MVSRFSKTFNASSIRITAETVTYQGKIIGLVEPIDDVCGVTLFVEPEDLDEQEMPSDAQEALRKYIPEIEEYLTDRCGYDLRHEPWPGRRGI
jgi:hypothetical protein